MGQETHHPPTLKNVFLQKKIWKLNQILSFLYFYLRQSIKVWKLHLFQSSFYGEFLKYKLGLTIIYGTEAQ